MDYVKLLGAGVVTVGATAAAVYMSQSPSPVRLGCDLSEQSVLLPGGERIRQSRLARGQQLSENLAPEQTTLIASFKNGMKISNDGPCLGRKPASDKPYAWMTYSQVLRRAENFGSGLLELGLKPENSTNVGIYSGNRPEYVIFDMGLYLHSMVGVPLYDTLGAEACSFIINQAEISIVVCDTSSKLESLLKRRKETPGLRTIVVMEPPKEELKQQAAEAGIQVKLFSDVEKLGEAHPKEQNPAQPDDLCLICYTSGTTGLPKGAMLTHKGSIAVASACAILLLSSGLQIAPEDCMISYLPLAHSYERLIENCVFLHGARIGFSQGNVKLLLDDIKELGPTIFPAVPRLLNRFYDKVMMGVNASAVKKFLFSIALKEKDKELQRHVIRNSSLWDRFIFKAIQQALGGRVRLITTGSAPLSPKILSFLRCVVGCPVLEGYGQTECHAIGTLQLIGDYEVGNVGPPLPYTQIKLVDVPEMEYYAREDKGEICFRGPNVFKGYLKDAAKTKEVLDADGWLHTGDIGEWLPNGCLKIIDRKKNIFKLAQGEYIAPEKIENIYVRSQLVAQMFVHGDSLQSCLIGIAVPDPDVLPKFAREKLGLTGTVPELARHPEVKKAVLADLTDIGKKAGLASFEQVKDIYVYPELFSVENGLLTPTFKAKRQELMRHFKDHLQRMYDEMPKTS